VPRGFFHSFQALGNQAPAPVKPRKGRQNQGEFPRRNLILSPRWGSREPEDFLDPGLAPWAKLFRPFGPLRRHLQTVVGTKTAAEAVATQDESPVVGQFDAVAAIPRLRDRQMAACLSRQMAASLSRQMAA
jgi:hypothetical protein